jgi:hypothetical protein
LQERCHIVHLRRSEPDVEALIVEIHHIQQCRRRTVVEIRRPSGQPAQNWSLHLADIGAFAGNQRSTRISDGVSVTGIRSRHTRQRKDRQIGDVQAWIVIVGATIRDAYIYWQFDRMVADIRGVMAGATESVDCSETGLVVDTRDASDGDRCIVEQRFAARDCLARGVDVRP